MWDFLRIFAGDNKKTTKTRKAMGQFWKMLKRYVPPYKGYLILSMICNLLAAVLTLFSFAVIMPILEMLFELNDNSYVYQPMGGVPIKDLADVAVNNFYYVTQEAIGRFGQSNTLALLGALLVVMTALKTGVTYLASYFIIPLRSGVVRDIRNSLYDKVVSLPIGFFTNERKGDVMARHAFQESGDDNSVPGHDGGHQLAADGVRADTAPCSRLRHGQDRQEPETQVA